MGIEAKKIRAENVVEGVQVIGVDPGQAENFLGIAQWILEGGSIKAEEIDATNLVEGVQWIANDGITTPTATEFGHRLAALEAELARLGTGGEPAVARDALQQAAAELQKAQPEPRRVGDFLKTAASTLADATKAAGVASQLAGKLAPLAVGAAKLWEIAGRVLGG